MIPWRYLGLVNKHDISRCIEMVPLHTTLGNIRRYSDLPLRVIVDSPFKEQISQTYGMLVYTASTRKWLMIQRKHSMELLLILKGSYTRELIPTLVSRLTNEEQNLIREAVTSRESYVTVLTKVYQDPNRKVNEGAWSRLREATPILIQSLQKSADQGEDLAWLWPKGYRSMTSKSEGSRDNSNTEWKGPEESRDAAMREFKEESGLTGISCPYTVSYESFDYAHKTVMGRVFTTRCWVCVMRDELELPAVKSTEVEVANRKWQTTEEVLQHLRGVELEAFQQGRNLVEKVLSVLR